MSIRISLILLSVGLLLAILASFRAAPEVSPAKEVDAARNETRAVAVAKQAAPLPLVAETASQTFPAAVAGLVQVTMEAPRVASASEPFDIHLRVDAPRGMYGLLLGISYDRRILALAGVSEGDFARRTGLPADFSTDEPSDGNIQLSLAARDGRALIGTGSLAVLHFEPRKRGTVTIAMPTVTAFGSDGAVRPSDATPSAAAITIY
jgi:hypothetical protein